MTNKFKFIFRTNIGEKVGMGHFTRVMLLAGLFKNDDCKIISRSAPNALGESYLENYMNNKKKEEKKSIPIIGNSPEINSLGISDYFDKSFNAIKGFFL